MIETDAPATDTGSEAVNPAMSASAPEFEADTGLESEATRRNAEALGLVLADCYQLFIKTQGVHWNVAGPAFYGIHKLTEEQYRALFETIDEIAERIRALGHKAPASYTTYGEMSTIRDEDRPQTASDMVDMLVRDNGLLCRTLRDAVATAEETEDVVTADLLTALLGRQEQAGWMLKMHVAG